MEGARAGRLEREDAEAREGERRASEEVHNAQYHYPSPLAPVYLAELAHIPRFLFCSASRLILSHGRALALGLLTLTHGRALALGLIAL